MKKSIPSIVHQGDLFNYEHGIAKPKEKSKSEDSFVFDLIDSLTAPVLTFSESWPDTIPQRLLEVVPLARMQALLQKEQLATHLECGIYIYTRTLEAPMDSEWTKIYCHVNCKVLQDWFGEDHWESVGAQKELDQWLKPKLYKLRSHIYIKRREILKKRFKEA
jgi:hypothetical protein